MKSKTIGVKKMLSDLETHVKELDEKEKQEKLAEERRIEEGFKLAMRGIRILKAIKEIPEIERYSYHQTVRCGLERKEWDENPNINYLFSVDKGKLHYLTDYHAGVFSGDRIYTSPFNEAKVPLLYRVGYVEERIKYEKWDPSISSLELTGKIGFDEMLRLVLEDINDRK